MRKMQKQQNAQKMEQEIREVLEEVCEEVKLTNKVKNGIDLAIEKEEMNMMQKKHFGVKRVVIGVAAACLLVSGLTFAGKTAYLRSDMNLNDMYTSYGDMAEVEKKFGEEIQVVESFSNGYQFDAAAYNPVDAYDEEHNKLYSYPEIVVNYQNENGKRISLYVEKPVEAEDYASTADAVKECGDITVYYQEATYKFVPPDYELTEEDKANQEKDNYFISYGSSEVEIKKEAHANWIIGDTTYGLLGFDLGMSADEMFAMAEEIIQAQ